MVLKREQTRQRDPISPGMHMNCADNDVDNKVWDADCTGYKICQNVRSHLFLGQNVPLLKFSSIVISVYELNI